MSTTNPDVSMSVSKSGSQSGIKAPSKIARPPATPAATAATGLQKSNTTVMTTPVSKLHTNSASNVGDVSVTDSTSAAGDFKLNDRVWVNGLKPGVIAFIGETQFKEGIWFGVILDQPEGKNNGTVNGVFYFQTEENRGVFTRSNKLTRSYDPSLAAANAASTTTGASETITAANSTTTETPNLNDTTASVAGMKVGDRVLINSSGTAKLGTLRFLGTADFAKGEWAGVELDERIGKNDGSVGAKRYFQCEPMYGLFAPLQKVQLYTGPLETISEHGAKTNNKTPTLKPPSTKLPAMKISRRLSASQESINSEKSSIYSTASGAVNKQHLTNLPPATVGTTSAAQAKKLSISKPQQAGQLTSSTPSTLNASLAKKPATPVTLTSLQSSLKDKESQITQLLKERDFERAEFTRAAQKFEQTEAKLAEFTKHLEEKDAEIKRLADLIDNLQEKKSSLLAQCELDKTKIEDLEFQIEEHKLGCVNQNGSIVETPSTAESTAVTAPPTTTEPLSPSSTSQEEIKILVQQLDLQKEISKSHCDEIKYWKEQVDSLNIEVKQLRLGEEVFLKEKSDLIKSLDEIEQQLKIAKQEADENVKLKDKLQQLETTVNKLNDENTIGKLKHELNELNSKLQQSESQKSEIEFLYEEAVAKLDDKIKEAQQASATSAVSDEKQTDLEFALEEHKILVQELKAKLSQVNAEKDELIGQHTSQVNSLNDKYSSFEATKNELITKLEAKINELTTDLSKINDKDTELNKVKAEFEHFKSEKEKENEELKKSLDSSNQTCKQQSEKCQSTEQQLEETKKLNDELQTRIDEFIKNSGDNSAQLNTLNENLKQKEKLIEELQTTLNNNQHELQTLKELNSSLEKTNHDNVANLDAKVNNLTQANVELEEKLKLSNQSAELLKQQLADKDANTIKLEADVAHLSSKLAEIEARNVESQTEQQKSRDEIGRLNADLDALKHSNDELKRLNGESNEHTQKLIDELGKDKQALNDEINSLKNQIESIRSEYETRLAESRAELEKSNATNDSLHAEKEKLTNELSTLKQDTSGSELIEQLKQELSQTSAKIAEHEEREIQVKQEYETTIKELKDIIQESDESNEVKLNELKQQLESDLKTQKDLIEYLESENEQLKCNYEFLSQQYAELAESRAGSGADQQQLNGTTNSTTAGKFKVASTKAAPRLYCDICDLFDMHDTDDCPQQSMQTEAVIGSANEFDTHSRHNAASTVNRAYCDLCEQFGHDEADCPNVNTQSTDQASSSPSHNKHASDEEF